jgi:hypothetical protein
VKQLLPDEYAVLSQYVDILPCNDVSPVYPFTGFVLNINVTTLLHRDPEDEKFCLLLIVSDCEGGELCFLEPGLAFGLKLGDVIAFPSTKLTHFNAHFSGYRNSLVLHSDKHFRRWVEDNNGWKGHTRLTTSLGLCE